LRRGKPQMVASMPCRAGWSRRGRFWAAEFRTIASGNSSRRWRLISASRSTSTSADASMPFRSSARVKTPVPTPSSRIFPPRGAMPAVMAADSADPEGANAPTDRGLERRARKKRLRSCNHASRARFRGLDAPAALNEDAEVMEWPVHHLVPASRMPHRRAWTKGHLELNKATIIGAIAR